MSSILYHHGVSSGYFFPSKNSRSVPWQGLVSVIETSPSKSVETIYYDGSVSGYITHPQALVAKISCYTYPYELEPFLGLSVESEINNTIVHGSLPVSRGFLTYKTEHGESDHYTRHLLCNLSFDRQQMDYKTVEKEINPTIIDLEAFGADATIGRVRSSYFSWDSNRSNPKFMEALETNIKTMTLNQLLKFIGTPYV